MQVTELSSKLADADAMLSRKEETLDSETRKLQLAQKRLDDVKQQQKVLKRRRDMLTNAKQKFQKEESDAQDRARDLKVGVVVVVVVAVAVLVTVVVLFDG